MENIFELNKPFDFSKLSLAHPSAIQGGSYFTKIEHGLKPLYIQTTKSQTKQGISKSGKKYYCDLMFIIEFTTTQFGWCNFYLESRSGNRDYNRVNTIT